MFPCFHVTYIKITMRIRYSNSNGENGNKVMAFLPSGPPAETPPMRLLVIILLKYTLFYKKSVLKQSYIGDTSEKIYIISKRVCYDA